MLPGQDYLFFFPEAFEDPDADDNGWTIETMVNETGWFNGISPGTSVELIAFGGGVEATKATIIGHDAFDTAVVEQFSVITVMENQAIDVTAGTNTQAVHHIPNGAALPVEFTDEIDYTYDSELSNGNEIPTFMTKKTDGDEEWIEVESTDVNEAGKYVVRQQMQKFGCKDEIWTEIEVNTTPEITFADAGGLMVYDWIETKIEIMPTPIQDIDWHDLIDIRTYEFVNNPQATNFEPFWERIYLDYDE